MGNGYVEVEKHKTARRAIYLEWIMVLAVLAVTCYLAIANNTPDIVFNLTTLCFGYYFRSITERQR